MPGVADNAASVGKIDASLALSKIPAGERQQLLSLTVHACCLELNQQLEARSERDQLVSKSILRGLLAHVGSSVWLPG